MEELFFIAVVPDADIREKVTEIKQDIADRFGSSHALRSPPHITLHMPFRLKSKKLIQLYTLLQDLAFQHESFEVELNDFDFFEPRVVFIKVSSQPKLDELYFDIKKQMKLLQIFNSDYKNLPFHPHLTVAFRDLKKSVFYQVKAHVAAQSFQKSFEVNEIWLLKHDQKRWQLHQSFPFNTN